MLPWSIETRSVPNAVSANAEACRQPQYSSRLGHPSGCSESERSRVSNNADMAVPLPNQSLTEREVLIVCRNSQGAEVRATPLRLTRYLVVFEVYNPYSILQLSEVLTDFKIVMNERLAYSGRAVV